MNTTTITDIDITDSDRGTGPAVLLLHGGGGPRTVDGFASVLADRGHRVITPVHPGYDGTFRPDDLTDIPGLARLYRRLLDELELADVTVVGNSIGGWIAAELGILGSPRIGRLVLVDAVGLQLAEHPPVDFFSLTMDDVADLSYFTPDAFRLNVATMPAAQREAMAANRETLAVYGRTMSDPTLLARLPQITTPTLVVWGAADRIVVPEHGRAYTAAIPGARFELIPDAGHLPQLETPQKLADLIS